MTITTNSAATGPLSLTRRGRLVLLGIPALLTAVALLAGLLIIVSSALNQAQADTSSVPGVEAATVEVGPGDTLWSVAHASDSEDDVRAVMAQIAELNSLEDSALQPGERLYVPTD